MRIVTAALAALALSAPAAAADVLGFEGVNPSYPSTGTQVLNFYDGGTSSAGTSGSNFGISFDANAIAVCLNSLTTTCSNASNGGMVPTSSKGALGLAADGVTVMDFSSAYTGAIGFRYAQKVSGSSFISAYDGAGGTGALLINLVLTGSAPGCMPYSARLCTFTPGGLGFLTNVKSLVFGGTAGNVVWDDITLRAGNDPMAPPALSVPEPVSWMMMAAGFALVGAVARRRPQAARSYSSISPDR